MDDEPSDTGFGNFAWYQAGRYAAENDREQAEFLQRMTGRGPVPVRDYNHVVQVLGQWRGECQRLQQVNADLQAQLNAAQAREAELRAWGSRCVADRDRWKDIAEERRQQTLMMGARADRFEDEVERLKGGA